MKMCPHCKINIGGNLEKCPLCQNLLTGEGERDYIPKIEIKTRLRRKAFKIVMFVFFALMILNLVPRSRTPLVESPGSRLASGNRLDH